MAAERKNKYWGEAHNARRREQYQNDPKRAEAIKAARRESYRKTNENKAPKSCLSAVKKVDVSGTIVAVRHTAGTKFVIGRVFTQTDVAELMGRQPQAIYRWHRLGIFPAPVLVDGNDNKFYADEEVKSFLTVMGAHQKETPHYRADHTDVRDKIFAVSFEHNKGRADAWLQARGEK